MLGSGGCLGPAREKDAGKVTDLSGCRQQPVGRIVDSLDWWIRSRHDHDVVLPVANRVVRVGECWIDARVLHRIVGAELRRNVLACCVLADRIDRDAVPWLVDDEGDRCPLANRDVLGNHYLVGGARKYTRIAEIYDDVRTVSGKANARASA